MQKSKLILIACLVLGLIPTLSEACQRYSDETHDHAGNVIASANVLVTITGTIVPATLYSDPLCATVKPNPTQSGSDGIFTFFIKDGIYDLTTTRSGYSFNQATYISIFDPLGENIVTVANYTTTDLCQAGTGAIDQIGATAITLVVNKPITCSITKAIPATLKLQFMGGGLITIATGQILTFPSPAHVIAPATIAIFAGVGTVSFTNGGTTYAEWWGASPTASATTNATAIQAAVNALPVTNGGDLGFAQVGNYHINQTITFLDTQNFSFRGVVPAAGGGAAVGTRLVWDGTASGTMLLCDACGHGVIDNLQFISGTGDYGVGIDWDRINGTALATHMAFRHCYLSVPAAGIGIRVSNIADANLEDGAWEDCFIVGPSATPGSRGTSVGIQIKAVNSFNHRWLGGALTQLFVMIDLPDNIATKSYPGGAINVQNLDGGYCDIALRTGSAPRHPLTIRDSSFEFCDQFLQMASQSGEEWELSLMGNRIVAPAAETVPYLDFHTRGTLTMIGNSFTDSQGDNASWSIQPHYGAPPGANVVAIGNIFPNATPFDTSKEFCLTSLGNSTITGTAPDKLNGGFTCYNNAVTSLFTLSTVNGVSGTATSANNLRGTLNITEGNTEGAVSFGTNEPDGTYFVALSTEDNSTAGTVAAGALRASIKPGTRANTGFTVKLEVAPDNGANTQSVRIDWVLIR